MRSIIRTRRIFFRLHGPIPLALVPENLGLGTFPTNAGPRLFGAKPDDELDTILRQPFRWTNADVLRRATVALGRHTCPTTRLPGPGTSKRIFSSTTATNQSSLKQLCDFYNTRDVKASVSPSLLVNFSRQERVFEEGHLLAIARGPPTTLTLLSRPCPWL